MIGSCLRVLTPSSHCTCPHVLGFVFEHDVRYHESSHNPEILILNV